MFDRSCWHDRRADMVRTLIRIIGADPAGFQVMFASANTVFDRDQKIMTFNAEVAVVRFVRYEPTDTCKIFIDQVL